MNQPNSIQDPAARAPAGDFKGEYHAAFMPERRRTLERGRTAVWQARLVILVMINVAQLWILSATVEAALARHYNQLLPLVVASGVCCVISLTIFLWWKPASRRTTSSLRKQGQTGPSRKMKRRIKGYDKDDAGDWRAKLECRHYQHVRHQPPLRTREWVLTEAGRASRLGMDLECRKCDEGAPEDFLLPVS